MVASVHLFDSLVPPETIRLVYLIIWLFSCENHGILIYDPEFEPYTASSQIIKFGDTKFRGKSLDFRFISFLLFIARYISVTLCT